MTIDNLENFWEIGSQPAFEMLALKTFNFQYENNKVYRSFCDLINCNPAEVKAVKDIPYLPISFLNPRRFVALNPTIPLFLVRVPPLVEVLQSTITTN